jgi:ComF family protein
MGCLCEDTWLCDKCLHNIETVPLVCMDCKTNQPRGRTCHKCKQSLSLTGVVSVSKYESIVIRRGISWLKFKSIKDLSKPLAHLLISRLTIIAPLMQLHKDTALVPVPLYRTRLQKRGFNQSLELCNVISHALKIPVHEAVTRNKRTWTQARLPTSLRTNNVNDAFEINDSINIERYKRIIIVDDVTTSGSTLNAVAKPLWSTKPQEIWGLTVARG